jgi:site-specific recombinase XerC
VSRLRLGEPETYKCFARPKGRFRLAADVAPGGAVPISDCVLAVLIDWSNQVAQESVSESTLRQYSREVEAIAGYSHARGLALVNQITPSFVTEWLHTPGVDGQPVGSSRRKIRLAALRGFFRTLYRLGIWDQNPASGIPEAPARSRHVAPLSVDQIEQLKRVAARRPESSKVPAALALVLLGASAREAAFVRVGDVDLEADRVWLQGGSGWYRDRWVPIDDEWVREALKTRIAVLSAEAPDDERLRRTLVVYKPNGPGVPGDKRSASITGYLTDLMKTARVYQVGRTRVESIREAVAARVFAQTGSVEATAERLGGSSLDGMVHVLGYDWAQAHRVDAPPPGIEGEAW